MKELILHTEYLLSIHECVIIPGLGGFISQISPARFEEKASIWFPPQKQISFNPSLFHNDGLLVGAYMETSDISYSEAFVLIEKSVLDLKKLLKKEDSVQFGRIGLFEYNDNGSLIFTPNETPQEFSQSVFGLQTVSIPLLKDLKRVLFTESKGAKKHITHSDKKNDTIYIPLKKRFIYQGIAIAAVVGLFMLFSTPIYVDKTQQTNYAKLLAPMQPTMQTQDTTPEISMPSVTVTQPEIIEPKEEPTIPVVVEVKPKEKEPEITERIPAQEDAIVQATNNDKFFIVIGSFPNDNDARKFAEKARTQGLPNASVLRRDGRFRVYANSFENRNEANQYMTSFKLEHKATHPNVWLYIAK